MATETIRNVKINKRDKYDTFTQVDTVALGIAAGKLKLVGLRLYTYLVSNKNGYNFSLSPLAYGRWYGVDYFNEDTGALDSNKRSGVNKAIRDGIADLIAAGYMKEVATNNYEFYECGEQSVSQSTVSSLENKQYSENNSFPEEQLVSQETVSSPMVFNF